MMEGKDSSGVSGVSGVDLSEGDTKMDTNTVSVRIFVPELNVQKVLHFHREELVWNVKQQCLATLPKVSTSPSSSSPSSPSSSLIIINTRRSSGSFLNSNPYVW